MTAWYDNTTCEVVMADELMVKELAKQVGAQCGSIPSLASDAPCAGQNGHRRRSLMRKEPEAAAESTTVVDSSNEYYSRSLVCDAWPPGQVQSPLPAYAAPHLVTC